ncbi:glycerophosphoryl diester phosphodiesterase [Larkinella arboricola]|uniref:Glycerophosphoryl diester phosphodiesterase n=1 Tax=Larkinella arboricola TaxID=643671 RepID=A0A327WIZ0_LARAB|nr:glycerophosphodiester phosphodiesterase family protein [Larkinella arboricola]RAJ90033.1 glycerophosphoryl diester phosphodiesterase [Larkinella arboricola]
MNTLRITFYTLLLSFLAAVAVGQPGAVKLPERGLCAHRGCMDTHPENTLPAFRRAIELGAQMIEFDVQLTKDGQLVIMHDETVDRTTNGHGKVSELTLAELRQLDAGVRKDARFAGTRIPTFEETLAIMPRNVWLNCHLKGDEAVGKAAAARLVRSGRLHQAFLACGEAAASGARQVRPDILICNSENRYRKDTRKYVDATIAMRANFIQLLKADGENRTDVMALLRKNGIQINYFYAMQPDELLQLLESGVDFVLVNNLADFQQAAKQASITPVSPVY